MSFILILSMFFVQFAWTGPLAIGRSNGWLDGWSGAKSLAGQIAASVQDFKPKDLQMGSLLIPVSGIGTAYYQHVADRQKRIQELRNLGVGSGDSVQAISKRAQKEDTAELLRLLNLGIRLEEKEEEEDTSGLEAEKFLLEKPTEKVSAEIGPKMWVGMMAGSEGSSSGSQRGLETEQQTVAMQVNPLKRAPDWYKYSREPKIVGVLEWELEQNDSKEMTFKDAHAYAESKEKGGWRLPTIWELEALYQQKSVLGDDLDTGWFWSETPIADYDDLHWVIDLSEGDVGHGNDSITHRVFLCREETDAKNQVLEPAAVIEEVKRQQTQKEETEHLKTQQVRHAASRKAEPVEQTVAIQVNPLKRAPDWYKYSREPKIVGVLEWELERNDSKEMTFKDARAYAESKEKEGWRLPTIWELEALYQQQKAIGEDLDTTDWFWSETPIAGSGGLYWVIDFNDGDVGHGNDSITHRVRLCRCGLE